VEDDKTVSDTSIVKDKSTTATRAGEERKMFGYAPLRKRNPAEVKVGSRDSNAGNNGTNN
jgi:hypothetical protein